MSQRVWIKVLSLGALLFAGTAHGQGYVQERGPRRPAAQEPDACETWLGDIQGNDPSARIVLELCARGGRVTGTFFWSSSVSGWDRRAVEGEWRDGGHTLAARDTAMLEAHPLHGWTLCTSDSYALRRVAADRLEGSYTSAQCRDHGRLSLTRRALPARTAHRPVAAPPQLAAFAPAAQHKGARCSTSPGMTGDGGAMLLVMGAVCAALAARRGRQSGDA